MLTLDECKAAIRKLSARNRAQLILWLARGMPADEKSSEEATQAEAANRMQFAQSEQLQELTDAQIKSAARKSMPKPQDKFQGLRPG